MEIKVQLSRPPLARMLDIHELLQRGQKTNRRTLSQVLEVSAKTVQRDIDFMRDQLGLPIEYDGSTHSYSYTRKVVQFPTMQISEGELVALSVAKKALTQYQSTPFEKPLRDAFEKLTAGLRDQIQFAWREAAGDTISFRASGQSVGDLDLFEAASQSVLHGEEIEFVYRKLGNGDGEAREVQPLHLACIEQQWYLFGFRPPARGQGADVRPDAHEPVASHRAAVSSGPNVFPSTSFSPTVSECLLVREGRARRAALRRTRGSTRAGTDLARHPAHRTPAGSAACELTMEVGVSPEVERWILGWGEHVEVLAPASLRAAIAEKTARVAASLPVRRRAAARVNSSWRETAVRRDVPKRLSCAGMIDP